MSELPPTRADGPVEILCGEPVADPFRWLEPGDDPEVIAWQNAHTEAATRRLEALPPRAWLFGRLRALWRYDDQTAPTHALRGPRLWSASKRADQDKWAVRLHNGPEDRLGRIVLDPNTWGATETLAGTASSADARYLAFGVARGGDENPVVRVLDLDNDRSLSDRLRGTRQMPISWMPDNSGFFYAAKPVKGEVPDGEEHYWHRVWWHPLGTDGSRDRIIHQDLRVKETYHGLRASEDGRWAVLTRSQFSKTELHLLDLHGLQERSMHEPRPMVTGFDHEYLAFVVQDRLLIMTDWGASRYRVLSTSVHQPEREHWTEWVAESTDTLMELVPAAGRIFLTWQRDASTHITVHDLDGHKLADVPLPGLGTGSVSGSFGRPEVQITFQSFGEPASTWAYDVENNNLFLEHRTPIHVGPAEVEQVWYASKDGTRVPMFLLRRPGASRSADTPVFLTGYGGFNISRVPFFSTVYAMWLEAGGMVAIPNLRGGGEFGAPWHEAGMRERKQNVFDDFIAAAEWLIAEGHTQPSRLAIGGGSNGGLLVSAAMVQRPELFRAVLCQVPLCDMLRFHRFGLANIWTQEYGSPDDPAMFPVLRAYSPYHNVPEGFDSPAALITGSANDARTDPVHARKFYARLCQATGRGPASERPVLLKVLAESGHHGGVTIEAQAAQSADAMGFLMAELGMEAPDPGGAGQPSGGLEKQP